MFFLPTILIIPFFLLISGECKSKTLPRIHIDAPATIGDGVDEGKRSIREIITFVIFYIFHNNNLITSAYNRNICTHVCVICIYIR